jgi:DNA polymerase-3 subunit gamma/tau
LQRSVCYTLITVKEEIKLLEKRLSSAPPPQQNQPNPQQREVLTATSPIMDNEPQPNVKVDIKTVKENELTPCTRWDEIMEEFRRINPAVAGSLDGSSAASRGNVMCVFTPNRFFIDLFKSNKDNAISLRKAIFNVLGERYSLSARCTATVEETKSMAEQLVKKAINSSIETAVDNKQ